MPNDKHKLLNGSITDYQYLSS